MKRRRALIGAALAAVIVVLTHTAPAPGLFDLAVGPRAVWQMPRTSPPTVYLTYDDGPNAATTPMLLEVLARERARIRIKQSAAPKPQTDTRSLRR